MKHLNKLIKELLVVELEVKECDFINYGNGDLGIKIFVDQIEFSYTILYLQDEKMMLCAENEYYGRTAVENHYDRCNTKCDANENTARSFVALMVENATAIHGV